MVMEQREVLKEIILIMNDKKDSLSKFNRTPYPALSKELGEQSTPQLVKDKIDYKAVIEQKRAARTPRFRVVLKDGTSYGCAYAHLIEWVYAPPHTLTLTTGSRIFVITGKYLKAIEGFLLEEKVKALHEFNPIKHQPVGDKLPLIEEITLVEHQPPV